MTNTVTSNTYQNLYLSQNLSYLSHLQNPRTLFSHFSSYLLLRTKEVDLLVFLIVEFVVHSESFSLYHLPLIHEFLSARLYLNYQVLTNQH